MDPLHGLNCCIDRITRCKRQCEKVREILLGIIGHVSLVSFMVHSHLYKIDMFALGKTSDLQLC